MEQQQPKKDPPVFERSIMLTRFKLSQQKRQLREKDIIKNVLKKSPKSIKKKQSTNKNKEKLENINKELQPNKFKRNKIVNKIVLKPKNDLKVIGWNGVKRKKLQMNVLSNIKRKKKQTSDSDRSPSPVNSEDFDEVMRMADDDLDDDDLMEILTCPSPVWWEEPPDDHFMEGPIVVRTNNSASMPDAPKCRRKQARKRTPQKIIIEENKADSPIENPLKIQNKTSDVFINKCNKLEGLLNTMKIKKHPKETELKEKEINEVDDKSEINDTSGDSSYLDMSLLDNDILKHLENIKIPIEDIEKKFANENLNLIKPKIYKHKAIYTIKNKNKSKNKDNIKTPKINLSKNIKLINNNDGKISKPRQKGSKNNDKTSKKNKSSLKNDKSLNNDTVSLNSDKGSIKNDKVTLNNDKESSKNDKVSLNNNKESIKNDKVSLKDDQVSLNNDKAPIENDKVSLNNDKQSIKNDKVSLNNDQLSLKDDKISVNDDRVSLNNDKVTPNHLNIETEGSERKVDLPKSEIPVKIKDEIIIDEEYVTVFEIINSDDDTEIKIDSLKSEIKTEIKNEIIPIEETEQIQLNSYYKKCKKTIKNPLKITNNMVKSKNISNTLDTKCSIIVPSTNDIKYCLKCSSIFETDVCSYCIKMEEKHKEII